MTSDGAPIERLTDAPHRPLLSVFSPDRLELVKGQPARAPRAPRPARRRALAVCAPRRGAAYREALAQRNALLGRVRAGRVAAERARAVERDARRGRRRAGRRPRRGGRDWIADRFARHAERARPRRRRLAIAYRQRIAGARRADELVAELEAALDDRSRARLHDARTPPRRPRAHRATGATLRRYGSQGEQRLALLALLLAERDALARRARAAAAAAARRRDERARRGAPRAPRRRAARAAARPSSPRPSPTTCPGWDDDDVDAGRGRVRRRAPRPLADGARRRSRRRSRRATPLARVQARLAARSSGDAIARRTARPSAERGGVLQVACDEAVWAAELELMGARDLVDRLDGRASAAPRSPRCAAARSRSRALNIRRLAGIFRASDGPVRHPLVLLFCRRIRRAPERPRRDRRPGLCHVFGGPLTDERNTRRGRLRRAGHHAFSRASRPSACGPACTSARPASAACTTSSTRSSTTPSTRRSRASAPPST